VSDILKEADGFLEAKKGKDAIGTTKMGIGPTYASKALRFGLRMGELADWAEFKNKYDYLVESASMVYHIDSYDKQKELDTLRILSEKIKADNMIVDSVDYMADALNTKKRIIAEGANATMLDIEFGTYPYVTSSSTTIGGVFTGLGVPPNVVETTIGIVKAYTTRVGGGPFPTEQLNSIGDHLQEVGHEYGATTGRRRRCGWLDLNVVKYSQKLNNFSSMNITKLDVLDGIEKIKVATHYEMNGKKMEGSMPARLEDLAKCEVKYVELDGWKDDISKISEWDKLPSNAKTYIQFIEEQVGVPVTWIGNGPGREQMITTF
jgi:adenylosuccinate synthase